MWRDVCGCGEKATGLRPAIRLRPAMFDDSRAREAA
jgi:hypothetical protein